MNDQRTIREILDTPTVPQRDVQAWPLEPAVTEQADAWPRGTLSSADMASSAPVTDAGQRPAPTAEPDPSADMAPTADMAPSATVAPAAIAPTADPALTARERPAPTADPRRNGDMTAAGLEAGRPAALFERGDAESFSGRWGTIQTAFVDDPRQAVQQADRLVADLMEALTTRFAHEKGRLEADWSHGDQASTEDLRVAFQHYRAFFDRLLAL